MKQSNNKVIWTLDSGTWYVSSTHNYILSSFLSGGDLSEQNYNLFKQMYHSWVDKESQEVFPPEFKHHPETGRKLERIVALNANDAWIAPYGQSALIENENRKDHGLQYSCQLKTLKNKKIKETDLAEIEIPYNFNGSMEFFSICVGTDTPQLIALNKSKDDEIFLLLEATKEWVGLKNTGRGLVRCPEQWRDYWGLEAFYQKTTQQHILLLPTVRGLAELSIDGQKLQYTVDYCGLGQCLGKPIYWNNCIYVPIDNAGKVQIFNYTDQKVELTTDINTQYFNRAVFESQTVLIWLSDNGQLILEKDVVEGNLSSKFISWLPTLKPDFRYGAPYLNEYLYQLCWHEEKQQYSYMRLNSQNNNEMPQICLSPRFTTGSMAYSLEGRISDRRDNKGRKIWNSLTQINEQNDGLFVPLMEDQDLNRELVLGIVFKFGGDRSIADIFNQQPEQHVRFRLNKIDGKEDFFSGQFSDPIRKSRFFYHHNYLYFYHQDRHVLQGWEV